MTWDTVQQLVRIIMQIAAGWMLNKGWITADMVNTLVGALVSVGGIIWWAAWQRTRPDDPTRL
jgi:hypothetical protein